MRLNMTSQEMQRNHSPSYQPGRTAQKDLIVPGGLRMRKGEIIIAALHHIHNNPKVWENPGRFDLDRWDTEAVKKRGRTDYIPYVTKQELASDTLQESIQHCAQIS